MAVDKWKNARDANMDLTTEEVAAIALPNAAGVYLNICFSWLLVFISIF